jgi:hypothetical protein
MSGISSTLPQAARLWEKTSGKGTRYVQHLPRRRREPKPLTPDPEADARVAAFFARMGITSGGVTSG